MDCVQSVRNTSILIWRPEKHSLRIILGRMIGKKSPNIVAACGSRSIRYAVPSLTSCLPSTQQQLQRACYLALAGGTMPFIRRYSTIWP